MSEWKAHRSKHVTYFKPWHPEFDMEGVTISERIRLNGGPKEGDMVAQYFDPDQVEDASNVQDHEWNMRVVTKDDFDAHYDLI